MFRTSSHDYRYYPKGWTDESTGTYYAGGYYDENGNRYDHVAVKTGDQYETVMSCEYCGTQIKLKWTEGAIPNCPNCGASLREVTENTVVDSKLEDQIVPSYSSGGGFSKSLIKGTVTAVVLMTVIPMIMIFAVFSANKKIRDTLTENRSSYEQEQDDSIYVDVLGRYCEWDDEYECYYDEESDCYFVFNDDIDMPEWQYWYEGISSDYGDYGWMAYNYDEHRWYIETSEDNWEVLPNSYDSDSLWYMAEMGTGKYDGQNVYYVAELDRECNWIPDEQAYYDDETDCYFYYNDYVDPPIWQYWYEGISSDYGDYGAMEYDTAEQHWYIESEDGWVPLPDSYDTSGLWYIED